MQVKIDLTNVKHTINDAFYPLLSNKSRYLVLRGSAGSGKSHFAIMKILIRIIIGMSNNTIHKVLCVRKTQPAIKRSVWALLKHYIYEWNLDSLCRMNNTDMTIQWFNGSQILCIGLDLADKIKSIEGITSIFCEEATELSEQDILQLDLRLRGEHDTYHQMMFAFNPVGRSNYIYKMFFEKEHEDTTLHLSTWRDNKWLDKQYTDMLDNLKEKDFNMWRIYSEGAWGELEHLIFNNWEIVDSIPDKYTNSDAVYGADWGYIHKTAIVKIVKDDDNIFIQEMFYESKRTNMDIIEWIQKNLPSNARCYADNAEPARLEEARRNNINMHPSIKGKNSVKDSIDFIKRHKLYVTKDSVGLINELQSYKWRQDRDGKVTEKPVDFNDDAIAAMRYGIYSHWSNKMDLEFITSGE